MTLVLPSQIALATNNRGKLDEAHAILGARGVTVITAETALPGWRIVESGETFEANALLKARDVARRASIPAIGDDSGLEVAALGGRPGVRSARYAGERASDAENTARLLDELRDVPATERHSAFRCALALAWPDGTTITAEGRCEGTIAWAPRGSHGFGYDPVFVDPATGLTFAELTAEEKNARSHRRRAFDALIVALGMRTSP